MERIHNDCIDTGINTKTLNAPGLKKDKSARPARKRWDMESDIVVVGYGGAGAVSAISANDAGAGVLILEKLPRDKQWSNTRMSGGRCHIANDIQGAVRYFNALAFGVGLPVNLGDPSHAYPHYPRQLVDEVGQCWGKGIVTIGEFLRSLGLEFVEAIPKPGFPEFPGAQNYGELIIKGKGIALFDALDKAVNARGIEVLWDTRGKTLIVGLNGEVTGVRANQEGKEINIKARKAVVLTTGGFEYDEELKDAFLPGWGWVFMGNPANTGDGLRMAMGAGAALSHMHHNSARVIAGGTAIRESLGTGIRIPVGRPGMILVDNYGNRYINEVFSERNPERYQFYHQVIVFDISKLEFPRIPSWFIFDESVRCTRPLPYLFYGVFTVGIYEWSKDNSAEIEKGWILKADTVEELARKIATHPDNKNRMQAVSLANTIARFNQYCEQGKDSEFNRSPKSMGPLIKPPYYAIDMYPGGPNTQGGPIRNARAQVMSVFGKPIPKLYVAGELGSVFSFAYDSGGNIADCIIFGRIAGQNAAMESSWD